MEFVNYRDIFCQYFFIKYKVFSYASVGMVCVIVMLFNHVLFTQRDNVGYPTITKYPYL